ncbi:tyrosine-type recombinase/integrase [Elizabethkingia anophelis]|uniref:tyrosine-type recombinase/integrase n=1 Tax=Elizabethkingia anophelis TaxID=1117645 RepID=UPI00389229B3
MKNLANGCKRTEVFISPKNYKTLKAKSDLNKSWAVECRFFDPKFAEKYPKGFPYRKKLNRIKCDNIQDQKKLAEECKEEMEAQLDERHYNPILESYDNSAKGELNPYVLFYDALIIGQTKLVGSAPHLNQIRLCVVNIKEHVERFRYDLLPIKDIKIWHIKNILERANMTPSVFNHSRSYLLSIFKELIQYGCIDHNPCKEIIKKKTSKKIRETFSDYKLRLVKNYLEEYYPTFHRYFYIFFLSGARSAELLRVKVKDVDLKRQEYKALVKKGNQYEEVLKVILPEALPYWKELLSESKSPEDYIFSKGLKPGPGVDLKPIRTSQITRRWSNHVKKSDKIIDIRGNIVRVTEDFYALKHLFLDKLDEAQTNGKIAPIVEMNFAQIAAGHKSDTTTRIYTTKKDQRNNEALKKVTLNLKIG